MVRVGWPHALLFRLQQSPRFYQYVCMVNVCAPRKSGENAARSVRVCRLCLPASPFFRLHLCALLSIAPDSSRCGQIQLLVRSSCGMFFGEQLLGVGHLSAREWSLNCLCSMRYQPMLASLICPPSTSQRCTRRLGLPFTLLCLSHSLSLLASRLSPLPCLWLMLLVLLTLLLLLLPHTGHHHNSAPVFVRFSPLGMVSLALMYFGCLGLPPLPPVKHPHPPPKHTHSLTPPSFHLATLGCDGDVWIDQVTRG
ncbi:hypothetical protein CABS01_12857 [Colletotrichum abscissum]|uniref:uncharacterized protein n=1 Tax=Colletotrichum abscissum TaxID=1671311 RepID=UPI0027D51CDD|nr:uncharacterized protein CABS01_12857 [Colletotrichum abscissum]KAK1487982.1 hypothetical protein CABS01_12857 [Colletotrichum abscissum]